MPQPKFSSDKYEEIEAWSDTQTPERGWKKVIDLLIDNPNDPKALVCATFLARRIGIVPVAYHLGRAAVRLYPHEPITWINFGEACAQLWLVDEAERAYKKGLEVSRTAQNQLACLINIVCLYIDNGLYDKAEPILAEILKIDPDYKKAHINLGFCKLARRDWSGWKLWHGILGTNTRPKVTYKDPPEPEWDGSPNKTVVLYAEQGIGDEISFASMIPDAAKVCKKLIFDCDGRLAGLFARSFPQVKVYGTRVKEEKWDKEDWDFDCSLAVGQCGEFFRLSESAFPGTPYLVPCPIRTAQWKSHFADKPVVGIAWTGGMPRTNQRNRKLTLKQLLPVLELPARFVSLQYKDATAEIQAFKDEFPDIDLVEFPWATESFDYDDTAALVAACDYVVCMQTAVAHTAGGLGVPVTVLVPKATTWRYGQVGETIPWYHSMKVVRQREFNGNWKAEIELAADQLAAHLRSLPPRAGEAAQRRELRGNGAALRADGESDHPHDAGISPP